MCCGACNKDGEIVQEAPPAPRIILPENETGIYTVKVGRELTLAPTVEHADNARIEWRLDGEIVCRELAYTAVWSETGVFYPLLSVQTDAGKAEEEFKVEVAALTPPVISLPVPAQGIQLLAGAEHVFAPTILHDDLAEFRIEWLRDGKVAGTERSYTFRETEPGTYLLAIKASNIDGESLREIRVEVVERLPLTVEFPPLSYQETTTDRCTFVGRAVCIEPLLRGFGNPRFRWSVDGEEVPCTERYFRFTPAASGDYRVRVTVSEDEAGSCTATLLVRCTAASEAERQRPATGGSSATQNRVYEWTPAPGQFIGDTNTGGMTGLETTSELACAWAERRLAERKFVSLGGFGGRIVVGFDHSIPRSGAPYDFAIMGDAFDSSNEPGIVWVMQDVNGNGLPDDEWYELRGSESDSDETRRNYAVTYFRPPGKGMPVEWVDSEGRTGQIDYIPSHHRQASYYPAWIDAECYTLRGTCLSARNRLDPATGYWNNRPYDWGYADNRGSDDLQPDGAPDGSGQRTGFRIANAIYPDGTPAELQYVDFIRVQVGVHAKSGILGELSTEVFSFEDLSLPTSRQ